MRKLLSSRRCKFIALSLATLILLDAVLPNALYALTSGPGTPEFSTFNSVTTDNMVNVFSGDFSYSLPVLSIPGPEGGGYALSLSYNSGVTPEQEASWVGFGWTLNAGAITRQMNGFPDDYNQKPVEYYNKTVPNYSLSAKEDISLEIFGGDLGFSFAKSLRYNNYYGMSRNLGFGLSLKGVVNLGMNIDGNQTTYSASVNPSGILNSISATGDSKEVKNKKSSVEGKSYTNRMWDSQKSKMLSKLRSSSISGSGPIGVSASFNIYTTQPVPRPQIMQPSSGTAINWSGSVQFNPFVPVGVELGFSTCFSRRITTELYQKSVAGFLYPNQGGEYVNDYYTEKNSPYSERSTNLGLPFNSADQFVVSGEGLSGGFRLHHTSDIVFHPNYTNDSPTKIYNWGVELMLGPNIGIGVDFGTGTQNTKSEHWNGYELPTPSQNGQPFFCFNNDLGGIIDYMSENETETNTRAEAAKLYSSGSSVPGTKSYTPSFNRYSLNTNQAGRSSFIGYSKLSDPKLNKQQRINDLISEIPDGQDLVGEFQVVNVDGNNYLYGLPVFAKNEVDLQFDLNNNSIFQNVNTYTKSTENVVKNYLVTKEINEEDIYQTPQELLGRTSVVIGEKRTTPYAQSYLLTQITTPDYIDVNDNGPDEFDFGGWTKFDYRKKYGGINGFYRWRLPYSGLLYHKNEISNPMDDMGSLSMGDKEVYYLKAIETKTHVAFFITNETKQAEFNSYFGEGNTPVIGYLSGSGEVRYDGFDADINVAGNLTKKGSRKLEKLERIVLYSKNDFTKPIQTTFLEYDNHLVKNLPNSEGGAFPSNAPNPEKSGKLTLKRLWSESEGVLKSKIAPYVFSYEYMTNYPEEISGQYYDITSYGASLADSYQNPDYSPYALSMWGSVQYDGAGRFERMQPWMYQGDIPENKYDPAAWHLKRIKLPSGGEIHVQYEQNDYCFVQDRRAMSMVSLLDCTDCTEDTYDIAEYTLNLEDIGGTSDLDMGAYRDQLAKYFIDDQNNNNSGEKIYFKFLYKLKGSAPSVNDVKSEYISGYASVDDIELINGKIKIKLEPKDPDDNIFTPRQSCYDFVVNRRGLKIDVEDNVTSYDRISLLNDPNIVVTDWQNKVEFMGIFKDYAKDQFFLESNGPRYSKPKSNEVGLEINKSLSYLKVPLPDKKQGKMRAKNGGGPRVKRLLMYDPGIENGDAALYGSEYHYMLEDGSSSGVATNEPQGGREENALVGFLPMLKQTFYSKLVSGTDKNQFEGPLGESILPAPSIGYSRVVIENIHSGKTGAGFSVQEYYTVKDYPFDHDYKTTDINGSGVDKTNLNDLDIYNKKDKLNLNLGLLGYNVDKVWASQGFRFIINNMHGQLKSIKSYKSSFDIDIPGNLETNLMSGQEYEYFKPGEGLDAWDGQQIIHNYLPGKQVDITSEVRSINDEAIDLSLEFDISVTLTWFPPVFPTIVPSFYYSSVAFKTFATTKVIKYPSIVKKVRNYQDGIGSETENLVFNIHTGGPILTKTTDGFDNLVLGAATIPHNGSIFNLVIPASLVSNYSEMGQKSETNPQNINQLNQVAGTFTTYGVSPFDSGEESLSTMNLSNVISAQAYTFEKNLFEDENVVRDDYSITSEDLVKLNEKWRMRGSYTYQISEVESANSQTSVYDAGYLSNNIDMFDWLTPDNSWIKLSEIIAYSPHGDALEEKNVLDIYSAVKYGYPTAQSGYEGRDRKLPTLIAKNAKYPQIIFDDFETDSETLPSITSLRAHSGSQSYVLNKSDILKLIQIPSYAIDGSLIKDGAIIKLWTASVEEFEDVTSLYAEMSGVTFPFVKMAQSGRWSLYEARIAGASFDSGNGNTINIVNDGLDVFVDDVVFHPTFAEVSAYVYDTKTLKLLTQFGSSHFGLYYRYNKEGQLVRKMIESEGGLKTIQETQYHNAFDDRVITNTGS